MCIYTHTHTCIHIYMYAAHVSDAGGIERGERVGLRGGGERGHALRRGERAVQKKRKRCMLLPYSTAGLLSGLLCA